MIRAWHMTGAALCMLLLSAEPHAFANSPHFTTTIFVCALEITPDKCDNETAIDVANGPSVSNEMMCGRDPQAMIAGTEIRPRAGLEYIVIRCQRRG